MSETTENVKALIETLTSSELQGLASYLRSKLPRHPLEEKWGISYELVLDAIFRSQDIVQRGVRGVIAEAVFQADVLPTIKGWTSVPVIGDLPYDFLLQQDGGGRVIKVQVKLQRTERGRPVVKEDVYPGLTYIVEVQKTRTGKKRKKNSEEVPGLTDAAANVAELTRPYQFGDFDILAVNMQPCTHQWPRFMYTVGLWLIPRIKENEKHLIRIMQPVSATRSDVWTDNIEECIGWFLAGEKKLIFDLAAANQKKLAEREAAKRKKLVERGGEKAVLKMKKPPSDT